MLKTEILKIERLGVDPGVKVKCGVRRIGVG